MLLNQKFKNRKSKSDWDQMGTKCLYFPKLLKWNIVTVSNQIWMPLSISLALVPGEYKWVWKISYVKSSKEGWNSVTFERPQNHTPPWGKACETTKGPPRNQHPQVPHRWRRMAIQLFLKMNMILDDVSLNYSIHLSTTRSHKKHFEKNKSTSCNNSVDITPQRNSRKSFLNIQVCRAKHQDQSVADDITGKR